MFINYFKHTVKWLKSVRVRLTLISFNRFVDIHRSAGSHTKGEPVIECYVLLLAVVGISNNYLKSYQDG